VLLEECAHDFLIFAIFFASMSRRITVYVDGFNIFKALQNIAINKPEDKTEWDELPELDLAKLLRGYYSGSEYYIRVKLLLWLHWVSQR
jgi:hypothetical protein